LFRRKKKEAEKVVVEKTLLEGLCEGDTGLQQALSRTLLLNPKITADSGSIESHALKAQEYEKAQDYVRARVEYQVAGELSLHNGKLADVQKFFKKAAAADPNYPNKNVFEYFTKKENAEKALTVAREYYTRTEKPSVKK
jgi:Tfp pilus assembly protein PilF